MNIYKNIVLPKNFYVYAYLREDNTVYYIGKGQGNRAYKKNANEFYPPSDLSRIVIVADDLLEMGAFILERKLIRFYGRKDVDYSASLDYQPPGILHNKTDGGEGGAGRVTSEATRALLRRPRDDEFSKAVIENHPANDSTRRAAWLKSLEDNHHTKQEGYVSEFTLDKHWNYDATEYRFRNQLTGEVLITTKRKFLQALNLNANNGNVYALTSGRKKVYKNWVIDR